MLRNDSVVNKLAQKHRAVLILLALLAISSALIVESIIAGLQTDAAEINVAGRQRMLSQKIGFLLRSWENHALGPKNEEIQAEILASIDLMRRSHLGLTLGDEALGLSAPESVFFIRSQRHHLLIPRKPDENRSRWVARYPFNA